MEFLGPDPIYRQIAALLQQRIEDGTYQPGHPIPSTTALVDEFGVAARTVRQAVAILTERGLLIGSSGRGVFVARPEDRPDSTTPADQ